MGIIKIEWDYKKPKAVKIFLAIIYLILHYIIRYIWFFDDNFHKFRSKSKIPSFMSIDFHKRVYPFIFFFIIAPFVFTFLFIRYIPENVFILAAVIYSFILAFIFLMAFLYLIYRILIDLWISVICFLRSFVTTTIFSYKFLQNIIKSFLSLIQQRH
jgi:hypothetical protein